jgi:hypothetical protein
VSAGATAAGDHVAFGFRLHGVPPRALIADERPDWPALHVRCQVGPPSAAPAHAGASSARLGLGGDDWLELDRAMQTAVYRTTDDVDEDTLVHPRLAPAATLMARWLDREALHAGAFLADGGAWGVAGANEAGKSTLLAGLALHGTPVFSDDLLVIDRAGLAYAGPRCLDLRRPEVLGDGVRDRLRPVRNGTRRRMDLPPVAAVARLRGWFFLEWGSRVEALPCRAQARLGGLLAQRRWATKAIDPQVLLALAALPAWTLRRPPGAEHLAATLALLHELTAPAGSRGSEAAA